MPIIACKGDIDNFGYSIEGGCSETVKVNGKQVALKDSTMNDGAAIIVNVSATVNVDGVPVAIVGSITEAHHSPPFLPGIIITGDSTVNVNG